MPDSLKGPEFLAASHLDLLLPAQRKLCRLFRVNAVPAAADVAHCNRLALLLLL
jgi:hypothetical protein